MTDLRTRVLPLGARARRGTVSLYHHVRPVLLRTGRQPRFCARLGHSPCYTAYVRPERAWRITSGMVIRLLLLLIIRSRGGEKPIDLHLLPLSKWAYALEGNLHHRLYGQPRPILLMGCDEMSFRRPIPLFPSGI